MFDDFLAVKKPLEIRLDYQDGDNRIPRQKSISITMWTPGHDFELAAGFLCTEGLVRNAEEIAETSHCGPALFHLGHSNVVKLRPENPVQIPSFKLERNFYTSSSCRVCDQSSIDPLETQSLYDPLQDLSSLHVKVDAIRLMPERLREARDIFDQTSGLHASALFDSEATLQILREDVGGHNALDKVIGAAFNARQMPLTHQIP